MMCSIHYFTTDCFGENFEPSWNFSKAVELDIVSQISTWILNGECWRVKNPIHRMVRSTKNIIYAKNTPLSKFLLKLILSHSWLIDLDEWLSWQKLALNCNFKEFYQLKKCWNEKCGGREIVVDTIKIKSDVDDWRWTIKITGKCLILIFTFLSFHLMWWV